MNGKKQSKFTEEQIRAAEEQITDLSKRISFYITEYTVEILALKMQRKEFEVPDYQRKFTWEPDRRSRFLESLLMGLPIPFLFFWQNPTSGKLEIVDGSQRLRTIQEFLLGEFTLGDLKELTRLTGFQFKDLPEARQLKVKNLSIRGVVLSEHADEHARLELFDRINTGSQIAKPAEVRRGVLRGEYQDLVISLANIPDFSEIAPVPLKKRDKRELEELVTRFFAYGDGLEDYSDRPTKFIFDYTRKMNSVFKESPEKTEIYRQRFISIIKFVARNFPWGFRKTPKGTATPRTRFEAIAIGSYLALQQRPELSERKICVGEEWLKSDLGEVTRSDGANAIGRLKERIYFVRDYLLEAEYA